MNFCYYKYSKSSRFVIEFSHEIKPKIEQNTSNFYIPYFSIVNLDPKNNIILKRFFGKVQISNFLAEKAQRLRNLAKKVLGNLSIFNLRLLKK